MRDYWLTKELLQAAGLSFALMALIGIGMALWLPKKWWGKLLAVIAVGIAISIPLRKASQETRQQQVVVNDYQARLSKARALFDERCKTGGEMIYRSVDGVEGVLLLNVRASDKSGSRDNPLWPDAALPHEAADDEYIRSFLYWEHDAGGLGRGFLNPDPQKAKSRGYRFVDVRQADGAVLRYRLKYPGNRDKTELVTELVNGRPARYVVDFVNQVDPDDRMNWVAGTTITVTDSQTNEVIATRESYAFESGLGSKAGARQPWAFAVTCPSFIGWDGARTRFFVDQVLKPKQGE